MPRAHTPHTMALDSRPAPSSLLFYTHNVARALKPSVDGELAHAIHETLHFALDGEPQDYAVPREEKNGNPCAGTSSNGQASTSASSSEEGDAVRPGFFETGDEERPFISYAWEEQEQRLILPHPSTVTNPTLADPCTNVQQGTVLRDAFDVTAKFFFLGNPEGDAYPSEWVDEALKRFASATGIDTVDTLILAFGDRPNVDRVASLWKHLSPNPRLLSLGLSDFSQPVLESLMDRLDLGVSSLGTAERAQRQPSDTLPKSSMTTQVQEAMASNNDSSPLDAKMATHVHIPSSPSKAAFTELAGTSSEVVKEYGPSLCRRPRLCAVNLKEQMNGLNGPPSSPSVAPSPTNGNSKANGSCCWDRGLADYCKERNILLVAHSDRKGEWVQ